MRSVSSNRQIVGYFESVQEFQRYFQEHDELPLYPGESLESYPHGMSFQVKKDAIYTRLTDLFQAMITDAIKTVECDPGQKLIFMGTEGFRKRMQLKEELCFPPGQTLQIMDGAILER